MGGNAPLACWLSLVPLNLRTRVRIPGLQAPWCPDIRPGPWWAFLQCRCRGRQFGKVALVDDKIIEVPPWRLFTDSKTLGWGPVRTIATLWWCGVIVEQK